MRARSCVRAPPGVYPNARVGESLALGFGWESGDSRLIQTIGGDLKTTTAE